MMCSHKLRAGLPPWDAHRAAPRGFTFGERSLRALCFFSTKPLSVAPTAAGISPRPGEPCARRVGTTTVPAPVLSLLLFPSPWD